MSAGTADDTTATLHLRCGSDIRPTLQDAGFVGAFLEFSDPYCQGPLPDGGQDAFIAARAAFIAEAYGISPSEAGERLQPQYDGLARLGAQEHVVLWFEHDCFDQLILAHVLSALPPDRLGRFEMICVDRVPGVERFIGLGQLGPEQLTQLWHDARRPVEPAQVALGGTVWQALRAPDLTALETIAREGTPALPLMARALRRYLEELPARATGLSLTERLTLEILQDEGPLTGGRVFHHLMAEREPLPYLGDLMFWHVLADMGRTTTPVYEIAPDTADRPPWHQRRLLITDAGAEVLAGARDFFVSYTGTRWIGGVTLKGGAPSPRWDTSKGAIVDP